MAINDPIGDMLTRIRNGQKARHATVRCPASKLRSSVLEVLKREGYIRGYSLSQEEGTHPSLSIELKYFESKPVIHSMKRISKPGRRVYCKLNELPRVQNGLGITILSTPKGVVSDNEARSLNVGGELLCSVY